METNPQSQPGRAKRWKPIALAGLLIAVVPGGWVLKAGLPWLHGIQAYIYGFPMMDLYRTLWETSFDPARGHDVREIAMTSGLQGIVRVTLPNGRPGWTGGADPRREGQWQAPGRQ